MAEINTRDNDESIAAATNVIIILACSKPVRYRDIRMLRPRFSSVPAMPRAPVESFEPEDRARMLLMAKNLTGT
jgi:hypothetical protein